MDFQCYDADSINSGSSMMNVESINAELDAHRLIKLSELANEYNRIHPESSIDLLKYRTAEEILFSLWERDINVGCLGFGYPYDEILKSWYKRVNGEDNKPLYGLETNRVYKTYIHADKIYDFLYYSLLLPIKGNHYPIDLSIVDKCLSDNLASFNEFWVKINQPFITNYHSLRPLLKKLTNVELCYVLWQAEECLIMNAGLSVNDFIDHIKILNIRILCG